jgi:hypothetical protein
MNTRQPYIPIPYNAQEPYYQLGSLGNDLPWVPVCSSLAGFPLEAVSTQIIAVQVLGYSHEQGFATILRETFPQSPSFRSVPLPKLIFLFFWQFAFAAYQLVQHPEYNSTLILRSDVIEDTDSDN